MAYKHSEERGQPAMAKPSAGLAGHGATTVGGHDCLQRGVGRSGQPKRGCRPWTGLSPAGAVALAAGAVAP
ncbi:hypothetical protein GW17_00049264, partial [Ensete ventricosum]